MGMNYFIFSLPRSRTLWVANFLTWAESHCYHEGWVGCGSTLDFEEKMLCGEIVGNCGSDNMLYAEWIFDRYPHAKFVYLYRDPERIHDSLCSVGEGPLHDAIIRKGERVCEEVLRRNGMLIDVDEWNDHTPNALWTFLLPDIPYPIKRNAQLATTRSEITSGRWRTLHAWANKLPSVLERFPTINL